VVAIGIASATDLATATVDGRFGNDEQPPVAGAEFG
jgi:hypothetical protein